MHSTGALRKPGGVEENQSMDSAFEERPHVGSSNLSRQTSREACACKALLSEYQIALFERMVCVPLMVF